MIAGRLGELEGGSRDRARLDRLDVGRRAVTEPAMESPLGGRPAREEPMKSRVHPSRRQRQQTVAIHPDDRSGGGSEHRNDPFQQVPGHRRLVKGVDGQPGQLDECLEALGQAPLELQAALRPAARILCR